MSARDRVPFPESMKLIGAAIGDRKPVLAWNRLTKLLDVAVAVEQEIGTVRGAPSDEAGTS